MTSFDYAVVALYFVFILAVGWIFRRFVSSASDYFRGGGKALWWMVGGSAFMAAFSAWTFTGATSQAYAAGWPVMAIYAGNAASFLVTALYFAPKFRQLRVITPVEAVRERFGPVSEQVFTWLLLSLGTLQAGVWLSSLGVFFSAVFGLDLALTIAVTGLVVLLISLLGGSWGVLASDFIQVLILMPVCVALVALALARVGGVGGFVAGLPAGHLDLGAVFSHRFLGMWCLAMVLKQIGAYNNLLEASRYLSVKDSAHARRAGFLGSALFALGLGLWFIPPMAARILYPDLHALFPRLANPAEGAFIAMARAVMPVGMMGLLVSGLFASTVSAMDAGLNKNAGVFVKNFYQPVFNPDASDAQLLRAGKIATAVLGLVVIGAAFEICRIQEMGLFLLMQRVSILVNVPIIVPLVLGLVFKRTPSWSGWSTVLVGFAILGAVNAVLTPQWAARYFGTGLLEPASREYWRQGIQVLATLAGGTAWFLLTSAGWRRSRPAHRARVEAFFVRLGTPVDFAREEGAASANDERQASAVGALCLGYGAFVCLLALIPNPLAGRLAFVFCGGVVSAVGAALRRAGRARRRALRRHRPAVAVAMTPGELENFLPSPMREELCSIAGRCVFLDGPALDPAQFPRRLAEADPEVLVACWTTPALAAAPPPGLRYLCYMAGSVKKLLTRAHLERGLIVTDWGGSVSRVVAECALLLTLAALRRGGLWIPAMRRPGAWKTGNGAVDTASLFGRRVGLHGFGRIARELIPLLRPFGADVGVCAPETERGLYAAYGVRRVSSLEELFAGHDVVVELAPLIPATRGIVTERLLRLLRPGAVFVNVGRGAVVDEEALARVAGEGAIQVGLDVFGHEPLAADSPLRGLPNVILLPHLGGPTPDRCRDAGAFGLRNLRAYAEGTPLEGAITPEVYDLST